MENGLEAGFPSTLILTDGLIDMKILVGTLYSGENEYAECLQAIRLQTYTNFDHIIIENKPELEAHYTLYKTFLDNADKYSLLIKVDADTVLCSADLFFNLAEKFLHNPNLEVLNIGVLDFFTDDMIAAGIQIYRNTVSWNFSKDTLFPDIPLHDPIRYEYDTIDLAPAALHSPNPSLPQAFHFGVHRGLKSIQKIHSTSHWALLNKVWQKFLRTSDVRLGLAVLASELVYAGKFDRSEHNYTNPKMDQVLQDYINMSAPDIKNQITWFRFWHWGFLPSKVRQKIIRHIRGKLQGRWDK